MEGLGAAASAFAVVSLAIQLAENAKKLYDFWKAVDEAPASIRGIASDLKLLSTVLAEIAQHEQKHGSNGTVTDVLESCTGQLQDMISMTSQLELGFASPSRRVRKWAAFKAVFKEEKIAKFQNLLLQTKTTLLLARQTLADRSIHQYLETNGHTMAIISQNMTDLQLENTQKSQLLIEPANSDREDFNRLLGIEIERMAAEIASPILRAGFQKAIEVALQQTERHSESLAARLRSDSLSKVELGSLRPNDSSVYQQLVTFRRPNKIPALSAEAIVTSSTIFGTVIFRQRTLASHKKAESLSKIDENETKISFFFRPSPWLVYLGLNYELRFSLLKSSWGWRHQFQSFQPVSDDALVFEFSRTGNIEGIKALLSRKEASVWDVNSRGWTPLHVAMHEAKLDVVKLLLAEGADLDAITYTGHPCCDFWIHSLNHIEEVDSLSSTMDFIDNVFYLLSILASQMAENFNSPDKRNRSACSAETCGHFALVPHGDEDPEFLEGYVDEISQYIEETLVKALAPEFQSFAPEEMLGRFLWDCFEEDTRDSTVRLTINAVNGFVDARIEEGGYTAIFAALIYDKYRQAEIFGCRGANLHAQGLSDKWSPYPETPTSLALSNSETFFKWRQVLRSLEVDMESFIRRELEQDALKVDGWTVESLRALFEIDYTPDFSRRSGSYWCPCRLCYGCQDDIDSNCCGSERVMIELPWQYLLADLRGEVAFKGCRDIYLKKLTSRVREPGKVLPEVVEPSEAVTGSPKLGNLETIVQDEPEPPKTELEPPKTELEQPKTELEPPKTEPEPPKTEPDTREETQNSSALDQESDSGSSNESVNQFSVDSRDEFSAYGKHRRHTQDEISIQEDEFREFHNDAHGLPAPKWLCIYCWRRKCKPAEPPPAIATSPESRSELDSDDEDSPFLLRLGPKRRSWTISRAGKVTVEQE